MNTENSKQLKQIIHNVDFCVVGGGMPGLTSAISAARLGLKVLLMHDRPMFGGNASSECRIHICGADNHNKNKNLRETGILEEIRMENLYRNPNRNFSIWDTILFEKILLEKNITSLLNCSCLDAEMDKNKIKNVTGWQLTTQTTHIVNAKIFADCSGDAILAPLTNANFRIGREASSEFGESIAPEVSDKKTMGMTCLFQAKKYNTPQKFEALPWAYKYDSCDELPYGLKQHNWLEMGYWWVELGGEYDSINDTEMLRDELLKITYGVWDHIKNNCSSKDEASDWAIDWIQFLPAKRESRRYVGEHILNQNDIEAEGKFEDIVGYGGWAMDDHHPAGFYSAKKGVPATIFHPSPSPYGIPYRSLYSNNINNLMFAGRNISATHAAMSSTRLMGTGCTMGQAIGTAASIAIEKNILPKDINKHINELQEKLINTDAYIPWHKQVYSKGVNEAKLISSTTNEEEVRTGINRPIKERNNCWECKINDWIEYKFDSKKKIENVSLILDSGLDQNVALSYHQKDNQLSSPPNVMPKAFKIEGLINDKWECLIKEENNYQRFCNYTISKEVNSIRFTLDKTWGAKNSRVYAFYFE